MAGSLYESNRVFREVIGTERKIQTPHGDETIVAIELKLPTREPNSEVRRAQLAKVRESLEAFGNGTELSRSFTMSEIDLQRESAENAKRTTALTTQQKDKAGHIAPHVDRSKPTRPYALHREGVARIYDLLHQDYASLPSLPSSPSAEHPTVAKWDVFIANLGPVKKRNSDHATESIQQSHPRVRPYDELIAKLDKTLAQKKGISPLGS